MKTKVGTQLKKKRKRQLRASGSTSVGSPVQDGSRSRAGKETAAKAVECPLLPGVLVGVFKYTLG